MQGSNIRKGGLLHRAQEIKAARTGQPNPHDPAHSAQSQSDQAQSNLVQTSSLSDQTRSDSKHEAPNSSPAPSSPAVRSTETPTVHLFRASSHAFDNKLHLLLATTGSVATIKLPSMLKHLSSHADHLSIRVLLSPSSLHFLSGQSAEQPHYRSLSNIPGVDGIYTDEDEWSKPWVRGDPILHISLRKWADLMVIAPLSANALAEMVNGLVTGLIGSVVRAWDVDGVMGSVGDLASSKHQGEGAEEVAEMASQDPGGGGRDIDGTDKNGGEKKKEKGRRKIIVVAPAMNTAMWRHPITGIQLGVLEDQWDWVEVLRPVEKALACGDVGIGAMMEWKEICQFIEDRMGLGKEHTGEGDTGIIA